MSSFLISRRAAAAWLCVLSFAAAACEGGGPGSGLVPPDPMAVASVEVTAPASQLTVGGTMQISATPRDDQGAAIEGKTISWASSAEGVATVSGGTVTAVAPGTAAIRATAGGKTGEVVLTILPVPIATIAITPGAPSVAAGAFVDLQVVARDGAGNALAGRTITLASSSAAVATVQGSRVTGVAPGTATIIATAEGKTASVQVTVTPAPVAALAIETQLTAVMEGTSVPLRVVARDAAGNELAGRVVTLTLSNSAVATLSNGVLTAVAPGTALLTATSEGVSATAQVTVVAIPIATLAIEPPAPRVFVGAGVDLRVIARDAAGNTLAGRPVTLSSSNTTIASVQGSRVTGVGAGTATITATAEGKTATAQVTVTPAPVATLDIDPDSIALREGENTHLAIVARDALGNTLAGRAATLTTSNAAVATLQNNVVTAVAPGTAIITATSEGVTATAKIVVVATPIATLAFDPSFVTMEQGTTKQVRVIARDASGRELAGRTVAVQTSNASVAFITSSSLVIEGRGVGRAVLTATAEGKTATATVDVVAVPVASVSITPASPGIDQETTLQLSAVARGADGGVLTGRAVAWTTSNAAVATVTTAGVVRGVSPGTATLTATVEGVAGSTSVEVLALPFPTRVSAGYNYSCGLADDGAALCWGTRQYGRLGDGVRVNIFAIQRPQTVLGGLSFATISAGNGTTCGVTTGGAAYCWGRDHWGQLGNGGGSDVNVPTAVSGSRQFIAISTFETSTCAIEAGGAAWCWGDNRAGQLGTGGTTGSSVPVPVSGGLQFKALDVGTSRACGVTTGGAMYCWGSNSDHALGTGKTSTELASSPVPVLVTGGITWKAVSVGVRHTCGLAADGKAYCWGLNSDARLGNGTNFGLYASPTAVSGNLAFAEISAGGGHTCAATTAGVPYCWGDNGYGQVGDGTQLNRFVPTAVARGLVLDPQRAASISAGQTHSCLVTAAGQGYCWGSNGSYESGTGGEEDANFLPAPLGYAIRLRQ